ncbi:MAG: amidase [Alphaproteobacteria bacterium]|nr:amidase [Alphaproteobacteria bacterium]
MDDPHGAFCRGTDVALDGAAEGPLKGLRFGVKDIIDIAGHRTGFGNPTWLQTHSEATHTASAVQRLLDAGADMVGKTLTDEMAYSLTGENKHYGTPLNPAAPDRIPGGSSNGSASAVATELVDFALGTDCGGSVRLPASYCGILGMRPTLERIATDGIIPFSASFDVVGWFAREGDLFDRVGRVLLAENGPAPAPRRLRVAEDAFSLVDPDVRDALAPAVERVAATIGAADRITVSEDGLAQWFEVFRVIQASEVWANHGSWIESAKPDLGRGVRERMEWASKVDRDVVARCRRDHDRIRARLAAVLEDGDVICMPTSPRVAPLKNTPTDDVEVRFRHHAMCLLCVSGLGGLPQISLPLARLGGLPLGLSIIARPGADLMLLGLAKQIMAGAGAA